MISPMTQPGTRIVVIDDSPTKIPTKGIHAPCGLKRGEVYTLACIIPTDETESGFDAYLVERVREGIGWDIRRFKPACLPNCLLSALKSTHLLEPV